MSKLSKTSLSIRKKWQQEAIKRGGNDAKIIISQSQAIPVVFDLLRDSFCPMNITSIYEVSEWRFLYFYKEYLTWSRLMRVRLLCSFYVKFPSVFSIDVYVHSFVDLVFIRRNDHKPFPKVPWYINLTWTQYSNICRRWKQSYLHRYWNLALTQCRWWIKKNMEASEMEAKIVSIAVMKMICF